MDKFQIQGNTSLKFLQTAFTRPNGNQIIKQLVRQKWHQDEDEEEKANHIDESRESLVYNERTHRIFF